MKATFALLFDHHVHNVVRKLAIEVHQTYRVGLAGSQLPPHVSLKQPFAIPDLPAIETYFDVFARSIEPVALTFSRIGGKKHEERAGFKVKSEHSARRVSSSTTDNT